jgi:hypothetical protein
MMLDLAMIMENEIQLIIIAESAVNKYLGFGSRNDVSGQSSFYKDEWKEDFKLWVIGTSYCHSRMFQST